MLLTAVSLHAFPFDNSAGALPRLAFFKTFLMGVPPIPGWCSIRFMYLYIECRMQRRRNLLRPRKAQRGPESQSVDITNLYALGWRLPTSRFATREVPHRFLYGTREEAPADYHYVGFQTEIHFNSTASPQAELCTTREVSHKQNYDQGGSPQPELRPGSLHTYIRTSILTTRELAAGWLAGGITTREPVVVVVVVVSGCCWY